VCEALDRQRGDFAAFIKHANTYDDPTNRNVLGASKDSAASFAGAVAATAAVADQYDRSRCC
jgi:hypothetical protein